MTNDGNLRPCTSMTIPIPSPIVARCPRSTNRRDDPKRTLGRGNISATATSPSGQGLPSIPHQETSAAPQQAESPGDFCLFVGLCTDRVDDCFVHDCRLGARSDTCRAKTISGSMVF